VKGENFVWERKSGYTLPRQVGLLGRLCLPGEGNKRHPIHNLMVDDLCDRKENVIYIKCTYHHKTSSLKKLVMFIKMLYQKGAEKVKESVGITYQN